MRKPLLPALAAAWLAAAGAAAADAASVQLGSATFRWLGIPLYRATLFTEGTAQFSWNKPLVLRLDYKRRISSTRLANATRDELTRLYGGSSSGLIQKFSACFQDVQAGDTYTAYAPTADRVELRLNGKRTCRVDHPGAGKRFLSIWLSPNSRAPGISAILRGQ